MLKMRRYLSVLLVLSMVLSIVVTSVPIYKVEASGPTNPTPRAESHIAYDVTISAFDQQTVKGWEYVR